MILAAAAGSRRVMSSRARGGRGSAGEQLLHASGNQHGDIDQHPRQRQAAARDQVLGLPDRLELRLVPPQPFEVVEVLAVAEYEVADAMPPRREPPRFDARQRRHAEVEPVIALGAPPLHQLDEQVVHRAAGGFIAEAHQVHRELLAGAGGPQIGEGGRAAFAAHQRHREVAQVFGREGADREALLAGGLAGEP